MAKAGDKSSTTDKVSTEKASSDEEIAGLFKPKSHKTRSTDDPQVKRARQRAVHNAVKKSKAGHRAPRMMSMWEKTERRKKTKWRTLLDRERKQRKRLFETAPAGGKQHRVAIREWWGAISKVLGGIKSVSNFDLDDLPYELFAMLAEQAAHLAVGRLPDLIKGVGGRGRTTSGPGEISDIRWAVTYVYAVRKGQVRGLKPLVIRGRRKSSPEAVVIAVVCRLYNLSDEQTVYAWCRAYKPFPYPEAWTVSSLRNRVADAARRYRRSVRTQNARTRADRKRRQKTV